MSDTDPVEEDDAPEDEPTPSSPYALPPLNLDVEIESIGRTVLEVLTETLSEKAPTKKYKSKLWNEWYARRKWAVGIASKLLVKRISQTSAEDRMPESEEQRLRDLFANMDMGDLEKVARGEKESG